jgi:hypothetical protein
MEERDPAYRTEQNDRANDCRHGKEAVHPVHGLS